MLRPEQDHFAEARDRLLRPPQPVQEDAEVGVGIKVIRVQANGCSIGGLRFDRFVGRPQQDAEIAVRIRVIRIERNGALVRIDGLIQPALRPEDDAQVAVPVRPVGHEPEALLDEGDGVVISTLLMREHACIVQRLGMVGGDVENPAIDRLRLSELLVLLQQDGDRHRFLERQFARRRF